MEKVVNVKKFLLLSAFNKQICRMSYKANQTSLLKSLCNIWDINNEFSGNYWEDYIVLNGEEWEKSSWCDKYTTVVFREKNKSAKGKA